MTGRSGRGTGTSRGRDGPETGRTGGGGDDVVVGVLLAILVPWVAAVTERADFFAFRFEGVNWLRVAWVVPLFYGGLAAGTYFLVPTYLEYFWMGHVLLAAVGIDALLHVVWPATPISIPLATRVTPLSGLGAVATLGFVTGTGWLLVRGERRYAYRTAVDVGQYLVPFSSISDRSDRMDATRAVALEKARSILVLGETGAGKTATIKLLVHQLQANPDEPFIVFDYKGEYQAYLEEHDGTDDHDREVIRLSSTGATQHWNLFAEIERESEIDELASAMFPQAGETEFFSTAARQLFVAVVTYLHRQAEWEGTTPTNADLVTFVQTMDRDEMHDRLAEHPDLVAAASAIDPDAERQAAGVYANFQQRIADLFRGDFAEAGAFSIREYMANPEGQTLLLDYPMREGDTVKPAFRFFVDWSARFALTDDRRTHFVLDEFARVPGLRKIGDLINAGRSSNTQLILGVQSVAQLHDTYGQDRASALLSGLVPTIAMRVGDRASVEYVRGQLGREPQHRTVPAHDHRGRSVGRQELQDETHPVAESEVTRLADGEAFVIVPAGWVRGQLARVADVKSALDSALTAAKRE